MELNEIFELVPLDIEINDDLEYLQKVCEHCCLSSSGCDFLMYNDSNDPFLGLHEPCLGMYMKANKCSVGEAITHPHFLRVKVELFNLKLN